MIPDDLELDTTAGSDAQLTRIEQKLDDILAMAEQVKTGITAAQKNPMIRQMLKNYGFGE